MGTVLIINGFYFKINTNDHEPAHVHVFYGGKRAAIWIGNHRLSPSPKGGTTMNRSELSRSIAIVKEHQEQLLKAWRKEHGER